MYFAVLAQQWLRYFFQGLGAAIDLHIVFWSCKNIIKTIEKQKIHNKNLVASQQALLFNAPS